VFEDRPSDSPFVERIWRCHSTRAGVFTSVAANHCELVVTHHRGRTRLTVRGPETRPTPADCPADAEWIGIRLSMGTWLPLFPAETVRDRHDADLPDVNRSKFRLDNAVWEYPSFDNAEVFVARLSRAGLIARDPAVSAALSGEPQALSRRSRRSRQRHFRLATGLTLRTYRQVERARYAAGLLRDGAGIGETVHLAGYYDQAHLTRSLTRLIGQTPARIRRHEAQLSLLYKTRPQG
jgi:hypothetical protein